MPGTCATIAGMRESPLIDARSLLARIADPALAVLDCRFELADPAAGRRAYEQGHIPGAGFLDLNRDLSAVPDAHSGRHPLPDPLVFAKAMGRLGLEAETRMILYDQDNGSFAARAWWMLRWIGARHVAVLDGGIAAWLRVGGALQTDPPPARPPCRFEPQVRHEWVAGSGEILAGIGRADRLLLDARAPARFAGEVEPIDPVAGHVPGARNHPFSDNLQADGRFLPQAELRRRWQERLAGGDPARVINMCGSGVTACHNLLAMEQAGLPAGRLYAGSWSEWIRDPSRPVERGPAPSFT